MNTDNDENSEDKGINRSFWTSLPGILTGAAGLLAALGTIVGFVHSQDGSSGQTWGERANTICAVAIKNGSGFIPSDPFNGQLAAASQAADNWQSVDEQLRKLPANGQDQGTVSNMLGYWDQAISEMQAAIQAAQDNYTAVEQQDLANLDALNTEGNSLANKLGAGTCASGEF